MTLFRGLQARALLTTWLPLVAGILWLAGCTLPSGSSLAGDALMTPTQAATAAVPRTVAPPTSGALSRAQATGALPATAVVAATSTLQPTETPQSPTATPSLTPTPTPTYGTHIVESSETLGGIAVRYGVSVEDLLAINELANPNFLTLGQALNIPPRPAPLTPIPLPDRDYGYTIAGFSAQGRAIEVFSFGDGPQDVLFVGGIHGGYEWNTVLLAYEIIDTYNGNRDQIPPSVTLHVIPVANPDGLFRVTGSAGRFFPEQVAAETDVGRFNGNNVDLNRNFGCNWSASATWGRTAVSPGSAPFSEPETQALRNFITTLAPQFVVFWHSAANLVSPGTCEGQDAGAGELAQIYGIAANYPWGPFDAYDVTGGASDWVVSLGIPAFAVELITHNSTEYGRNLAGVQALLGLYWGEEELEAE